MRGLKKRAKAWSLSYCSGHSRHQRCCTGRCRQQTCFVAHPLHAGGKVHGLADGQLWQVQVCLLDVGGGARWGMNSSKVAPL